MPGWSLNIPENVFDEIYGDTIDKKIFKHRPETDEEFIQEFLVSKLWRMNHLYTIVDKFGKKIPFKMNWSQHMIHAYSMKHPKLIILKSRQQGISTYYLVKFYDDAITIEDLSIGLMAQGKREASKLLGRTKILMDEMDPAVLQFLQVYSIKDNTEAIEYSTGSNILIGVSFRSTTLQRLHISEFGKIANEYPQRAEETKTGTLQAIAPGNEVAIESTAEGENIFSSMWDEAILVKDEERTHIDFLPVFLSWVDDPDCVSNVYQHPTQQSYEYFSFHEANGWVFSDEQKNWWIAKYRELKTKIKQEYPLTPSEAFEASKSGSYWFTSWRDFGIKRKNVYNPQLETFIVMDLGVNDTNTVLWFHHYNKEKRIFHEYGNNNQGVRHYVEVIRQWCNENREPLPRLYLPHDSRKQAQTDLKTAEDLYRDYGFDVTVLERPQNKVQYIDDIRNEIEQGHYVVDEDECPIVMKTMSNYSKEWDDKYNVWKKLPKKDKWDHWADCIIYMNMASAPDDYFIRKRNDASSNYYGRGGYAV